MKLGWYGPFVGLQTDLTTAFNTEYITFVLSFVSDDWCMERVTICTKAFPGKHSQEEIGLWVRKITKDVFQPVLGAGNDCEPSDIYIGATVDQGRNFINALESMNVPVNVCYAHKLNTVVGWGLGINGSASTCKNLSARKLMNKAAAMVGHFSHSAVNNDAFKDVQRDMDELEGILGLVRRNDTRWGSQHAMMLRMIKLHKSLQAYFADRINGRELQSSEWRAVRQLVSVLDPAAAVTTQIQRGRHGFIGKAINGFTCLFSSLLDGTQEIRDLDDPDNGPRTDVSRYSLTLEVQRMLDVMTQDMAERSLGKAVQNIEAINLVLDPRFKTCCSGVCLNGGDHLRGRVNTLMETLTGHFVGNVAETSNNGATEGGEPESEGEEAGGDDAAGGGGSEGQQASAATPQAPTAPPMSRIEKIRRQRSLLIEAPGTGASTVQDLSRSTAAAREYEEYLQCPPAANSHDFDIWKTWKTHATDGVDAKTGEVITPARWPHIGLIARLHLSIDATSCQAERNFSALSGLLSDQRGSLSPRRLEMVMLLKLNSHLTPGLKDVMRDVKELKKATTAHVASLT